MLMLRLQSYKQVGAYLGPQISLLAELRLHLRGIKLVSWCALFIAIFFFFLL